MKLWHSEFNQNYGTYTFGYGAYATLEPGDALADIYAQGFLPYSGSRGMRDTFYMARSARVGLKAFEPTSENRRVLKKFDGVFDTREAAAADIAASEQCMALALDYFAKRHGPSVMPMERLKLILSFDAEPTATIYEKSGAIAAFTLHIEDERMMHFWYSFYDLALVEQSLGMWLMLDAARDAQARGKEHFYQGTVYGQKALYKTNFPSLSWWDGKEWRSGAEELKARARSDGDRTASGADLWKDPETLY